MKMGDDHVGSEWDYVLDSLLIQIETGRLSDFVYTDEFSTTATILESASDLLKYGNPIKPLSAMSFSCHAMTIVRNRL